MRLAQDSLARIKNFVHAAQGVLLFLAWALTIAVFTRDGKSDGRTGWYFGLCWLTIPAIIYLVMVPMWSRAQRFANVYAFAAVDGVLVILWLSAWASVASYVVGGKGKGKDSKKSGCDNFKYGSPGRCKLSEATIILGVIIMILFIGTSYISFKAVTYYKRTGTMPTASGGNDFAKHTQDAFSSNMRNDEFDEEADLDPRQGGRIGGGGGAPPRHSDDDEYALLHQTENDDVAGAGGAHSPSPHPGRPVSYGQPDNPQTLHDYDTSYGGAYGHHNQSASGDPSGRYGSGNSPYGR